MRLPGRSIYRYRYRYSAWKFHLVNSKIIGLTCFFFCRIKSLKRKIQREEDSLNKRKKLKASMRKNHQKIRTKRLSNHKYLFKVF